MNAYVYFRIGSSHENNSFLYYSNILDRPQHLEKDHLPKKSAKTLRICIISDTHDSHEYFRNLPDDIDILCHCGDIFMTSRLFSDNGRVNRLRLFNRWLGRFPAKYKIVIGGNHDLVFEKLGKARSQSILTNAIYLENSGVEVEGLTFWGSPHSIGKSENNAFQSMKMMDDTSAAYKQFNETNQIDILLTHGPLYWLTEAHAPNIGHFWGHAHFAHGIYKFPDDLYPVRREITSNASTAIGAPTWFSACAAIVNEQYNFVNEPIIFDLHR
jgi:predicted phosphodiesterase